MRSTTNEGVSENEYPDGSENDRRDFIDAMRKQYHDVDGQAIRRIFSGRSILNEKTGLPVKSMSIDRARAILWRTENLSAAQGIQSVLSEQERALIRHFTSG
jgi:hypothetical protein